MGRGEQENKDWEERSKGRRIGKRGARGEGLGRGKQEKKEEGEEWSKRRRGVGKRGARGGGIGRGKQEKNKAREKTTKRRIGTVDKDLDCLADDDEKEATDG